MAYLFACMLAGYLLNRLRVLPEGADGVISKLENYVFVPALIINSFQTYCTPSNLAENAVPLFYSIALLALSAITALLIAPFLSRDPAERGIFRYSLCLPNFGFMGNSLVLGLFGEAALFRYLIFTLPQTFFVYSAGFIWLTAGKRRLSPRMLLNSTFLSVIIGVVLGMTRLPLPGFLDKTISSCAACYSPLAMILTGYVIGRFRISRLLHIKSVYVVTALRLMVLPLATFALIKALAVPSDIALLIMVFSSMPLGLNTIVFPAAYGGDETLGASMALISNPIGLVTVPLMLSLVI